MKKFFTPFVSSIYYDTESRVSNHDDLKKWILDLYAHSPTKGEGNFYHTGFTSYFYDDFSSHLDTIEIFKEVKELILSRAKEFIDNQMNVLADHNEPRLRKNTNIRIQNMWFNVNPPGGYQGRHHHSKNLLGGTYYIDVPPESGKIGFFDPNPFAYLNNQELPASTLVLPDFSIQTKAGDLLIWPGWMDHEISVNSTKDQNRITLSFAIDWEIK